MSKRTNKRTNKRKKRLQRFIENHATAFAVTADRGFRRRGRGAVVLIVENLEGGEKFLPQTDLALGYAGPQTLGAMSPDLLALLDRYNPPGEAVFVVAYPNGYTNGVIADLNSLKRSHPPEESGYLGAGKEVLGTWPDAN